VNVPVTRNTIHDVIRTGVEILSASDDVVAVVARQSGIVRLGGEHVLEGMAVSQGQALFNVSGGEIAFENIDASREEARATLDIARSELSRKQQLRDDKLITTTEYEAARLDYEQADIRFKNLERNYGGSKAATSPINGFIRSVLVGNGDHVSMGQTLALVMRNRSLLLKADVPLRYAETLGSVGHAHFRPANGNRLYDTRELDGKAVSVGKASHPAGHTVPIHFRMNAAEGLTPGSYAEVFLMTTPINDALTIPVSALIEEQGAFHAYVQTGGESFEKRSLTLGVNDGRTAQVLQGLREGERVVSKGAYRIKIAQAGGSIPAHGHEH